MIDHTETKTRFHRSPSRCERTCGRNRTKGSRHGVALVFVLVVIAMLTYSAYTFTDLMIAEKEAAILAGRQLQARALVDSGVDHVRYFLELPKTDRISEGGVFENPNWFQSIAVIPSENPAERGRFTVIAPMMDSSGVYGGIRFGLENESARLNLNALNLELLDAADGEGDTNSGGGSNDGGGGDDGGNDPPAGGNNGASNGGANNNAGGGNTNTGDLGAAAEDLAALAADVSGRAMLMAIPGMTEDIADAILDWIDEDDEVREYGAEFSDYSSLGYAPKNGPLETIEELLMVRGVTPELLFGRDVNRNGIIDTHEQDLPLDIQFESNDGSLDRGWSGLFTLYSAEKNANIDGLQRIYLNTDNLEQLHEDLTEAVGEAWATFIVAYRQSGPLPTNDDPNVPPVETEPPGDQPLDFTRSGEVKLTQVLDLVGVNVRANLAEGAGSVVLESPFPEDPLMMGTYLPMLMDNCTVNQAPVIPGRININQASAPVLMAIPGITEEMVDAILSEREITDESVDENLRHETWLLTRLIVTLDEMKLLQPFITAGGDVYRAQVVGYFDEGAISSRAEVVIDASELMPRILFWRDISHLGRGFGLETLGILTN